MGIIPGGMYRNRDFRLHMVDLEPGVPEVLSVIMFDPQTSGGLLMSLAADEADALLAAMHAEGLTDAAIIGEVVGEPKGRIVVR